MKHLVMILLMLVVGMGCGSNHEAEHDDDSESTVSLYHKDRGLLLPAELRASLGIRFIEVANVPTTVPKGAVVEGVQEDFVYVQNGDHVVRTPVVIGVPRGEHVEITEGILAGDYIVATGAHDLWMIELLAVRGGSPCCPVPKKDKK